MQKQNITYKPLASRLCITSSSRMATTVVIAGVEHSCFQAEIKKNKDLHGIERAVTNAMGRNPDPNTSLIQHEIDNVFDEVYLIPNSYSSYGSRGIVSFLFVLPLIGKFLVDLPADNITNALMANGIGINSNCRLSTTVKLAASNYIVPLGTDVTVATKAKKEGRVKLKELEVGGVYQNSNGKYYYLGREDGELVFMADSYYGIGVKVHNDLELPGLGQITVEGYTYTQEKIFKQNGRYTLDSDFTQAKKINGITLSTQVIPNFRTNWFSIRSNITFDNSYGLRLLRVSKIPTLYVVEKGKKMGAETLEVINNYRNAAISTSRDDDGNYVVETLL